MCCFSSLLQEKFVKMQFVGLVVALALTASAWGFHSPVGPQRTKPNVLNMQTALDPLPKLFVYDHW